MLPNPDFVTLRGIESLDTLANAEVMNHTNFDQFSSLNLNNTLDVPASYRPL